ncbi:MAG: hypothetical protein JWM65_356 [Sphingomonas bacterium]|nr:hypothetical protein [Sphingomonas bacterium]
MDAAAPPDQPHGGSSLRISVATTRPGLGRLHHQREIDRRGVPYAYVDGDVLPILIHVDFIGYYRSDTPCVCA